MNYRYGKELQKEIVVFPHALDVDPEGIIMVRFRMVAITPGHSDDYVHDINMKITTSDNKIHDYMDFVGKTIDDEHKKEFVGILTSANEKRIRRSSKQQERVDLSFEALGGIISDDKLITCPFGVPIWGSLEDLNNIIAIDIIYMIGNKTVDLHIPVEIHLTEDRSITMVSLTYDPEDNVGGCATYMHENSPEISVISDYEEQKKAVYEQSVRESKNKAAKVLGTVFKDTPVKTRKMLFESNKNIKNTDADETYCLKVPDEYSYRMPVFGVLDEELSII